jgi:hypothetical protein
MERGKLLMQMQDDGSFEIVFEPVNGNVWLSEWQIAGLFGVFAAKVSSNIRSILKFGVLPEDEVRYCFRYVNGDSVDLYSLEMILALAFRIHSPKADFFRKWAMEKIVGKRNKIESFIILNSGISICMN